VVQGNCTEVARREMRLKVEKLIYGGWGLGRLEGQVVLVPRVLPGEEVEVRVERQRRDYLVASPVEVVEPAEGRIEPPCPHFDDCGGCDYQHIRYDLQLEAAGGDGRGGAGSAQGWVLPSGDAGGGGR